MLELLQRHLPVFATTRQGASWPILRPSSPIAWPPRGAGQPSSEPTAGLASAAPGGTGNRLELDLLGFPTYGTTSSSSDHLDAVGRDYVLQAREMHKGEYRIACTAGRRGRRRRKCCSIVLLPLHNKAFLGFGLHGATGDGPAALTRRPAASMASAHNSRQRCAGSWSSAERGFRGLRGARLAGLVRVCGSPRRAVCTRSRRRQGPEVSRPPRDDRGRGPAGSPGPGAGGLARRQRARVEQPRGAGSSGQVGPSRRPPREMRTSSIPTSWLPSCCRRPPRPGHQRPQGRRSGADHLPLLPSARVARTGAAIVSLDSAQDALPPPLHASTRSMSGEIEHPLPLEIRSTRSG